MAAHAGGPPLESIEQNFDFIFHRMIDTKTMTSLPPFQKYFPSTTLQTVLETLSSDPFHIPECGEYFENC